MKAHLLLLAIGILLQSITAPAQKFEWLAHSTQGTMFGQPLAPVEADPLGNVYTFMLVPPSGITIEGTLYPVNGSFGQVLAKYDPSGDLIWGKVFGSNASNPFKLTVDNAGAAYVSVESNSLNVTDDTTFTTSGASVFKIDSTGRFIRKHHFFGPVPPRLSMLGTDLYVGTKTAGAGIPVIQKLDSAFNVIWSVEQATGQAVIGGDPGSFGDIYVQDNAELVATFIEAGTNNIGPAPFGDGVLPLSAGGQNEAGIVKMDTTGHVLWARTIPFNTAIPAVAVDHDGNVFATYTPVNGTTIVFAGETLVNTFPGQGQGDYFAILKWDANGNEVWGKAIYTVLGYGCQVTDLEINAQNELLIAAQGGAISWDADTTVGLMVGGPHRKTFLLKVDNDGAFMWSKTESSGITLNMYSGEIAVRNGNEYIVTGSTDEQSQEYTFGCFSYLQSASTIKQYVTFISEQPECNPLYVDEPFESAGNELIVHPNPTTGLFAVDIGNTDDPSTVELFNSTGERVLRSTLIPGRNTIDLSGQASGIYIVQVAQGEGRRTAKLVVE